MSSSSCIRSAARGIAWAILLAASPITAPAVWAEGDEPEIIDEYQAAPAPPKVTKRVFQHEMAVTAIDITRNGNVAVTGSVDGLSPSLGSKHRQTA